MKLVALIVAAAASLLTVVLNVMDTAIQSRRDED